MKKQAMLWAGLAVCATGPMAWADEPVTTKDLVVTATRQPTDISTLAGNTQVISQDAIDFTKAGRPSELLNQIPGLNIQQGSGEEHLTAIRSPVLNGGAGAGSFLYLEDGVPLRAAGFADVNGLMDGNIDQAGAIEVVRGPGSALYGSNAEHGMINFISRAPSRTAQADLDVNTGSNGLWRGMTSVSNTFGDQGVRISGLVNHTDGWRINTRVDNQKISLQDVITTGDRTVSTLISADNLAQQTGTYITTTDAYKNRTLAMTNPIAGAYRKASALRAQTRWQEDLDDSLQLSITPYVRYVGMNFMMHYVPSYAIQQNEHVSIGSQFALYKVLDGGHKVIVGTDVEYTNGNVSEFQNKATFVLSGNSYTQGMHYDFSVNDTVIAPYVHSEWQVLDHTRVTAGMRYEEAMYEYTNNIATGTSGLYKRPGNRTDRFGTFTPKLGVVQQWSEHQNTYLNLSTGSRAPQVTDLYELQSKQTVGQIKSERLRSLELGERGKIGDVTFDLASYWMMKDHYFYRAADGTNVIDGKTQHRGLELSASAPLAFGFDIGASTSYALHTYDFNRTDSTVINSVHKGGLVPGAPRSLANVRLGYHFAKDLRGEGEWVHVGGYYTDNADTHFYGGHDVFNLRLTAKATDALSFYGAVMNVADIGYADRAAITTTGVDQYFPGAPRTFMAGVSAHF